MKILVANLGSTSFKYRLYDMPAERLLARGGVERIGAAESRCVLHAGGECRESTVHAGDHGDAVRICLGQLSDPACGCLKDPAEVAAIGFKTVHGGPLTGAQRVTPEVLAAMEAMNDVAPAHNPPYIAAMRLLSDRFPKTPLVAAFETGFHQSIPDRNRYYSVPWEWSERFHVRRWGFHGASHRYIVTRIAEILGRDDLRVVSCHLGGSSSLCAARCGQSVMTSMGMSPQSGLAQNNRAGDFDPFAIPVIMRYTGKSFPEVLDDLASRSGLLGLSGISGDIRDLEAAAADGNPRAQRALDVFIGGVRQHLGGMLVELGGAEVIVFTGGIGENSALVRERVCAGLDELGIVLDPAVNAHARHEAAVHAASSRIQIWTIPTNEELVVARQAYELLEA